MKVILLQDVAKIGRRFEIVNVPTGYALNKLIPKGMVETATTENVKKMKAKIEKFAETQADLEVKFKEAVSILDGKNISISVQANEKGHMFETLKSSTIAEALQNNGAEIFENQIVIMTPIKEVGEHTITLSEGKVSNKIILTIVST